MTNNRELAASCQIESLKILRVALGNSFLAFSPCAVSSCFLNSEIGQICANNSLKNRFKLISCSLP